MLRSRMLVVSQRMLLYCQCMRKLYEQDLNEGLIRCLFSATRKTLVLTRSKNSACNYLLLYESVVQVFAAVVVKSCNMFDMFRNIQTSTKSEHATVFCKQENIRKFEME